MTSDLCTVYYPGDAHQLHNRNTLPFRVIYKQEKEPAYVSISFLLNP